MGSIGTGECGTRCREKYSERIDPITRISPSFHVKLSTVWTSCESCERSKTIVTDIDTIDGSWSSRCEERLIRERS